MPGQVPGNAARLLRMVMPNALIDHDNACWITVLYVGTYQRASDGGEGTLITALHTEHCSKGVRERAIFNHVLSAQIEHMDKTRRSYMYPVKYWSCKLLHLRSRYIGPRRICLKVDPAAYDR
jgi:hypothetical protein